jgi:ankyrin repeat protein
VRAKADVTTVNESGNTPAQYAADRGHHGVVEVLVRAKVDVNKDLNNAYSGITLAHVAARRGHHGVVEVLVRAKADVNKAYYGGTLVHYAARCGHHGVVEVLVRAKADLNKAITVQGESDGCLTAAGSTPLDVARLLGHTRVVAQLLLAGGAGSSGGATVSGEGSAPDTKRAKRDP